VSERVFVSTYWGQQAGQGIGEVEGNAAVAVAEGLAADPHHVTGCH
jgi:hypothetical protein